MKIDYSDWYDESYWSGQKEYCDGQKYHGPGLQWEGFRFIADALAPLVPGKSILDVGCGGGDLVNRFAEKGYDAYGVDVSRFATQNCVPDMQGRIAIADITTCPKELWGYHGEWHNDKCASTHKTFPTTFDVVMATDLLEHIYMEDLQKTMFWLHEKSTHWFFFCIAVADGEEFVHTKGEDVPPKWQPTAVSGHVNVRRWQWWAKYFRDYFGPRAIRWDLMYIFQLLREQNKPWKATGGWDMPSTWILEKQCRDE